MRTLLSRLLVVLCSIASVSTGLTLVLHDRTLSRDLEHAARGRLETATFTVRRLLGNHLGGVAQRWEALSGTPQFRANVEVDDPPTLEHLARRLRENQRAAAVAFLDRKDRFVVVAGDGELARIAASLERPDLIASGGHAYAATAVALETLGRHVGRLVAVEELDQRTLAEWSQLCGSTVRLAPPGPASPGTLRALVRHVGDRALEVETSMHAEETALAGSRRNLASAGFVALATAFAASLFLARSLVGPIGRITEAAQRIGRGDFSVRVNVARADELGRLSRAMQEMAERLERESRAKTEFLANVSHEIRTPMTAILGFTDLLVDQRASPRELDAWRAAIRTNGAQLLHLIDQILEVARIESGTAHVEPTSVSPFDVISEALASVAPRAREKGLELRLRYPTPLPRAIQTDPTRLRQVLVSLLDNAIKFTEEGSVELSAGMEDEGTRHMWFAVSDTGIGIPSDQLARIFEPFSQVDTSHTRRFGGTGLGLAFAHRLARMLGGDLEAESALGAGSRFVLRIDPGRIEGVERVVSAEEGRAHAPDEAPRPLSGRVLLAEDGPDNQRLIAALLRREGMEVELAANGQEAVACAIAAWQGERPFDLVLMDMQMPVLDGYEATRQLRAQGYGGPIVALTAHAASGERERCLEAGCNAFATKPIDRSRLRRILSAHLVAPKPEPV